MTNIDRFFRVVFSVAIAATSMAYLVTVAIREETISYSESVAKLEVSEAFPAGSLTASKINYRTFIQPAANLDLQQQMPFWIGFSFFRDPWVVAPASTTARDGLGPLFNARSCIACHIEGGRGALPSKTSTAPVALLIKLGKLEGHPELGNRGDPIYGQQLQVRSVDRRINKGLASDKPQDYSQLTAEGAVVSSCKELVGRFVDGEIFSLCKPQYEIRQLAHGETHADTLISPRLAPPILGLGLLEMIPSQVVLMREDIDDENKDGISGKANWVIDVKENRKTLGRFGFKASQPSVAQQNAAAFVTDIGITNSFFLKEECSDLQTACKEKSLRDKLHSALDIEDSLLKQVNFFTKNLTLPPTRNFTNPNFVEGRRVFYRLNCNGCHQPNFEVDTLEGTTRIWPYTDLLLHDMGDGLADGRGEFLATNKEWRTAPLWGLGLQEKVTGQKAYLHDGRARSLQEALLWHGGEAEQSKQRFLSARKADREALLFFLKSI